MTKLLSPLRIYSLGLALATMFTATGCELYFGGHNGGGGDRWTYCGSDGYYVCNGDNCDWAGARCPNDPNYTCTSNQDCAGGCFCSAAGVCEEAGFCATDQDCPEGFTCDEARSSCVPNDTGPTTCAQDVDCPEGQYCQDGLCTASCHCTSDADAQAQGWNNCDEARGTCEPTPAYGTCAAPATTCNLLPPTCGAGQVPLTDATGCYAGGCLGINLCDVAPGCKALQHEADCLGDATCTSVYTGINCTKPDGSACVAGDTGCTCQSFQYNSCATRMAEHKVVETPAGFVDLATYLRQ